MSQEMNYDQNRSINENQELAAERLRVLGTLASAQPLSSTGAIESGLSRERQMNEVLLGLHIASTIHECGGQAIVKEAGREDLAPDVLGKTYSGRRIGFYLSLGTINREAVYMKTLAGQSEENRVHSAVWIGSNAGQLEQCEVTVLELSSGDDPTLSEVRYGTIRNGRTAIARESLHDTVTNIMTGELEPTRLQRHIRESGNTVQLQQRDQGWRVLASAQERARRQAVANRYDAVIKRRNQMKDVRLEEALRERLCGHQAEANWAALDCARLIRGSGQAPVVRIYNPSYAHIHFDGVDFLMISQLEDSVGSHTTRKAREILAEHPDWYWVDRDERAVAADLYAPLMENSELAAKHVGFHEARGVLHGAWVLKTDLQLACL